MSNLFPSENEITHITATLVPLNNFKSENIIGNSGEIENLCLDVLQN